MTIGSHCLVMNHAQVEQVTVNHVKSVWLNPNVSRFESKCTAGELVSLFMLVPLFMGYTPTIKHIVQFPQPNMF